MLHSLQRRIEALECRIPCDFDSKESQLLVYVLLYGDPYLRAAILGGDTEAALVELRRCLPRDWADRVVDYCDELVEKRNRRKLNTAIKDDNLTGRDDVLRGGTWKRF